MLESLISSKNQVYSSTGSRNLPHPTSSSPKGSDSLQGDHIGSPQTQPESVSYFMALSAMDSQDPTANGESPPTLAQEHAPNPPTSDADMADQGLDLEKEPSGGVPDHSENHFNDLQTLGAASADDQLHAPGADRSAPSHVASSVPTSRHTFSTLNGHDPTNKIPVLRPDGSPVKGGDKQPLLRPDDGRDPQFFEAQGEFAAEALISSPRILHDLSNFRTNGPWDEQRAPGDRNIKNGLDQDDRNYATVAIGLYGCAAGIPIESLLVTQDRVFLYKVLTGEITYDPKHPPKAPGYAFLPMQNYLNTKIGYSLCENHVFPIRK